MVPPDRHYNKSDTSRLTRSLICNFYLMSIKITKVGFQESTFPTPTGCYAKKACGFRSPFNCLSFHINLLLFQLKSETYDINWVKLG